MLDSISLELWITVAIILLVIGEIAFGYLNDDDDVSAFPFTCLLAAVVSIWPYILVGCAIIGCIALPLWIGKFMKKIKERRNRKKIKERRGRKKDFMEALEKYKIDNKC